MGARTVTAHDPNVTYRTRNLANIATARDELRKARQASSGRDHHDTPATDPHTATATANNANREQRTSSGVDA